MAECLNCKEKFIVSRKTGRIYYCSNDCKETKKKEKKRILRIKNKENYRKKNDLPLEDNFVTAVCPICKQDFTFNQTRQPNKKYCSDDCRKVNQHTLSKVNDNRFIIFQRDTFKCIYCGKTTKDYDIVLTVDHIIPQNKGGKHIASNLISSCLSCNSSKQDKQLSSESFSFVKGTIEERNKAQGIDPNFVIKFSFSTSH